MKKISFLLILFMAFSCKKEDPKSNLKAIASFVVGGVTATIDETAKTITAILPLGTDLSKLSPTIAVSPLATISPATGIVQDFSKPVVYTLIAEDGSTATYTANISRVKSTDKAIVSFVVGGVTATIDETAKTITLALPANTDITKLSPTIAVSPLATISPATGVVQDFTKPVVYTLTAEDGSKITYTATVSLASLTVKIPDVNFEKALIDLKIDDKQDGEVLRINAEKVSNLNVSSKNIITLVGIEAFTNLRLLSCKANKLASLDISKNIKLEYLECSSNQLTSLDVTKNTVTQYLDCSFNQLTSIDVTKNTALTVLYCRANNLASIDVTKNTILSEISCFGNQIINLDISRNTVLTRLSCYWNQITSLDISKNTILIGLSCDGNQITSLDVTKNVKLEYLECSLNQLTSLDVTKNTALNDLRCFSNQLTSLDFTKNTVLQYLDCNANKLASIDITKNTVLVRLTCTGNQLTSIDVSKITALNDFNCQNNKITTICVKDLNQPSKNWLKDETATYKVCN